MSHQQVSALIKAVFQESPQAIMKLESVTNRNYLVTLPNQQVVCRLPDLPSPLLDRATELAAQTRAAKFNVPTCYFDLSGVKITQYQQPLKDYPIDYIKQIANLLRQLHQLPTSGVAKFDLLGKLKQIRSAPLEHEEVFLQKCAPLFDQETHFCHNDLLLSNFLFTGSRVFLIDYEFAALNNPLFDLASFISENQLGAQERRLFLEAYFEHRIDSQLDQLVLQWEVLLDCYWYHFALHALALTQKEIWASIAKDKKNAYLSRVSQFC